MTERLKQAQEAKKTVLESGEVEVDTSTASLAFGISKEKFHDILGVGKSLVVEPLSEERVKIYLSGSLSEEKKDLWQEMVDSLERGRSEIYLTKRSYVNLARNLQRGSVYDWEEDADILHLALFVLWEKLPSAIQKVLDPISPERIRSNVGILGSRE